MSELYKYIGNKIRELRKTFAGGDLSQEELAEKMDTKPNTISRWETAIYKPSAKDLHNLSKIFGVSISVFFPNMENTKIEALLSAMGNLGDDDIDELTQYARFRQARLELERAKKKKKRGAV